LKHLVASARGVAATMPAGSSVSPNDVLDAAGDILDKSANLITAAKTAAGDPDNPDSRARLTQVLTILCCHLQAVVVWRSGNIVGCFNLITLCWARLVLGWVTVFGWANHLVISPGHPGQLSLLVSVGWEMTTSQSAMMVYGWGVIASLFHLWMSLWVADKTV